MLTGGTVNGPIAAGVRSTTWTRRLLTLIELRDRLLDHTAPGGRLILSGITRDQEERIAQAFAPPLALAETTRLDEWSCMTFLCPSSS